MHLGFDSASIQLVLWTLTFASLLVLLIVLQGRERVWRFPGFTASIILVTLEMLSNKILHGRLPQLTLAAAFIVIADLLVLIGVLVVVEMAWTAFTDARRSAWIVWSLILLTAGACVVAFWGKWPDLKTLSFDTPLARLGLMQLFAQKTGLLVDVLNIGLGLLIVAFGWRYGAGRRSHVQRIMIGLSTASLSQIAVQVIWQVIVRTAGEPHSRQEYERIVGLQEKLFNANSVVYLAVVIWWIVCLWTNEPAAASPVEGVVSGDETPLAASEPTPAELPEAEV
jgi:hypothetical protein